MFHNKNNISRWLIDLGLSLAISTSISRASVSRKYSTSPSIVSGTTLAYP